MLCAMGRKCLQFSVIRVQCLANVKYLTEEERPASAFEACTFDLSLCILLCYFRKTEPVIYAKGGRAHEQSSQRHSSW